MSSAQTADAARDDLLVIPGSPDDYWKAASLSGAAPVGPRFLLEFIRAVEAMEIHDPARLRSIYEYLGNTKDAPSARSFAVPLPLRASVWSKLVSANNTSALFAAVIRDRRARRLLYGAAALDPETRTYIEARTPLVEKLFRNHSDVFTVQGRSFTIREGRVDVPGGSTAAELWELLVGAPVSMPEAFLDRLMAADTGELAALYDAVAHLDAPHQRFVLGLWMPDVSRRRARVLTLYRAARAANRRVAIAHQPFVRTGLDLFAVVSQYRVMEDGRPAPPASPDFWRPVFAQIDRWPDTEWSGFPDNTSVDATWLVEVVLLSARPIWEQAGTVFFAQRVSAPAAPAAPPSNEVLMSAVRQFRRFPTVILALERAGVRDTGVFVSALNRASAFGPGGSVYWQRQALAQFQGALAIVEQLRRTERLTVPDAERVIVSLARIEPSSDRAYAGGIARWIAEQLLPALGTDTNADSGAESRLLSALAGAPRDQASMRRLTWEDWEYRIDPSIVSLARLKKIRAAQAGNSLDTVLRVREIAASLAAPLAPSPRGVADALTPVKQAVGPLRAMAETIREPVLPTDGTRDGALNVKATLKEVATTLEGIRDARQSSRVQESAQRLLRAVDVVTADVLVQLLYAVHIGDPDSPLWLQGDVAYRHDFGLRNRDGLDPEALSWSFPIEQLGTTWHVRGSILGLDLALARLRLPQVAAGGPPAVPVMAPEDQRVFLESVVLFDAGTGDEAMRAIGDGIRAGRARVTTAKGNPQALDQLASIGRLGEWRRHYVLPWLSANRSDEVLQTFSLTELYWIGMSGRVDAVAGGDVWGTSAFPVGGCLCLRIPAPQAWEDVAGRIGAVPTVVSDATFRLAELLSESKLPAVLARHILPVLMRDFIDRVQMIQSDDWSAVTRYWASVPRDRIEDVVGQLTANGPLIAGEAQSPR